MNFTEFFNKRIKPFLAIAIFLMLLFIVALLYQDQEMKREISDNCGWEDEAYKCYCEKNDVVRIENILNGSLEIGNVTMVG